MPADSPDLFVTDNAAHRSAVSLHGTQKLRNYATVSLLNSSFSPQEQET